MYLDRARKISSTDELIGFPNYSAFELLNGHRLDFSPYGFDRLERISDAYRAMTNEFSIAAD